MPLHNAKTRIPWIAHMVLPGCEIEPMNKPQIGKLSYGLLNSGPARPEHQVSQLFVLSFLQLLLVAMTRIGKISLDE